ncbi:MAG: ATP-binding protein [Planctomycetota bacterium]|nr:ATP-binding protein [Planctomycetota bacterium]
MTTWRVLGKLCVMASLSIIHGPDLGKRIVLPLGDGQLLGRSSEALPSSDRMMSRRHAELTPERDGGWAIRDLASRHGTRVNGERIESPRRLRDGDQVRCGETLFLYEDGTATDGSRNHPPTAAPEATEAMALLAHSIKNMLQGLRGGADAIELALARSDLELARKGWPLVARNLDRIFALSLNMLAVARPRPIDREEHAIGEVVRDAAEMVRPFANRRAVTLSVDVVSTPGPVWLDGAALHHALLNLFMNAVEAAAPKSGRVVARVHAEVDSTGSPWVVIEVEDNGPGIDSAITSRLFEPFVSSKGQRGSGLGLIVSRNLIRAHQGDVVWDQSFSEGCRMTVRIPAGPMHDDPDETRGPEPTDPAPIAARFD